MPTTRMKPEVAEQPEHPGEQREDVLALGHGRGDGWPAWSLPTGRGQVDLRDDDGPAERDSSAWSTASPAADRTAGRRRPARDRRGCGCCRRRPRPRPGDRTGTARPAVMGGRRTRARPTGAGWLRSAPPFEAVPHGDLGRAPPAGRAGRPPSGTGDASVSVTTWPPACAWKPLIVGTAAATPEPEPRGSVDRQRGRRGSAGGPAPRPPGRRPARPGPRRGCPAR